MADDLGPANDVRDLNREENVSQEGDLRELNREHLQQALRHVQRSEARVSAQYARVVQLRAAGQDSANAEKVLTSLQAALSAMRAHLAVERLLWRDACARARSEQLRRVVRADDRSATAAPR